MTLVVAELVIPALAFLGLQRLYAGEEKIHLRHPAFLTALGLTGGLALVFYIVPGIFSFFSKEEVGMFANWMVQEQQSATLIQQMQSNLEDARIAIFRADALRSLLFALATAATVLLFAYGKIKKQLFVVVLAALLLLDMVPVSMRYFDHDKFVPKRQAENPVRPTQADLQILEDNDTPYRVYNVTVSSFNDSSTSYFHHSIGGYHGAKLQRYQELIDHHITKGNMEVLNMLNTKYLIVPGPDRQPAVSYNDEALGHAWFVKEINWVEDANEEIEGLNEIDPAQVALIDRRFEDIVDYSQIKPDPRGSIELISYKPNELIYRSRAAAPQLALFSEVYYPHGWEVYINGEKAEHFRANYILRAMVVPEGDNEIEFRFRPQSFYTGKKIALVFSIILGLTILVFIGMKVYKPRQRVGNTPEKE